jgi:hypothetical protein
LVTSNQIAVARTLPVFSLCYIAVQNWAEGAEVVEKTLAVKAARNSSDKHTVRDLANLILVELRVF